MKINLCDKWFSIFIRLRDADENGIVKCCTCGKLNYWKNVDCGHFCKRQHQATRYDERNCHGQCKACNYFEQGAEAKHAQHIIKLHGESTLLLLQSARNSTCKRSKLELDLLTKIYKEKAIALAKEKGIVI